MNQPPQQQLQGAPLPSTNTKHFGPPPQPTYNSQPPQQPTVPPPQQQPPPPKPVSNKKVPKTTFDYSKKKLNDMNDDKLASLFDRLDKLEPNSEPGVTAKEKVLDNIAEILEERQQPKEQPQSTKHSLPAPTLKNKPAPLPNELSFIKTNNQQPKHDQTLPHQVKQPQDNQQQEQEPQPGKLRHFLKSKAAKTLHSYIKHGIKTWEEASRGTEFSIEGSYKDLYGTKESEDDIKEAWEDVVDEYPVLGEFVKGKYKLCYRYTSSVGGHMYINATKSEHTPQPQPKQKPQPQDQGEGLPAAFFEETSSKDSNNKSSTQSSTTTKNK